MSEEELQGSWVELHYSGSSSSPHTPLGGSSSSSSSSSQVDAAEQSPPSAAATATAAVAAAGLQPDVETMLLEAQRDSTKNSSKGSSQCNSPLRSQTPLMLWKGSEANSTQSDEDLQERKREVENLLVKNADWIWDWSSRPENNPPKEFLLRHPAPRRSAPSLSIRNTRVMKSGGVLSPDFLKLFLPSLILSHILAIGLGIYIGKRLTSHNTY